MADPNRKPDPPVDAADALLAAVSGSAALLSPNAPSAPATRAGTMEEDAALPPHMRRDVRLRSPAEYIRAVSKELKRS